MTEKENLWVCKNCSTEFIPKPLDLSCSKCRSNNTFPKVMKKVEEVQQRALEEKDKKEQELASKMKDFLVVTTPTIQGYRIKKVLGAVSGLSPRTRGFGGRLEASLESMVGGEITAFKSEIEKARLEAISRAIQAALDLGANAMVGLDMETSSIGQTIILISATATAVQIVSE
jgi:uncharacterized protein YbjQ (UPF0145 family)